MNRNDRRIAIGAIVSCFTALMLLLLLDGNDSTTLADSTQHDSMNAITQKLGFKNTFSIFVELIKDIVIQKGIGFRPGSVQRAKCGMP